MITRQQFWDTLAPSSINPEWDYIVVRADRAWLAYLELTIEDGEEVTLGDTVWTVASQEVEHMLNVINVTMRRREASDIKGA